jgi:hypothetical protein
MTDCTKYKHEVEVKPQKKKYHDEERQVAETHFTKHEGNIINNIMKNIREYNATVKKANKNNTFILYNDDYNKIRDFIQDNQFSKITFDPTNKLKNCDTNSRAASPSLIT